MPEVTRVGNYVIVVNLNDHEPAHVHVSFAECEVRVLIMATEARLHSVVHGKPKAQELRKAVKVVARHLAACLAKWKEIHG